MKSSTRKWLWSVLLPLPFWILLALHFVSSEPGTSPTGCIQLDTPFYAARIREVFDTGQMTPFFSNPCAQTYDSPQIYFQLHTFLLALVAHVAHIPSVYVMLAFQCICSILFARISIALLDEVTGELPPWNELIALLFFWGGGVFCMAGIGAALLQGAQPRDALFAAFQFEPDHIGWWSLNVGRNIATQFEGYFHAFFFLSIFALMKERFVLSLACAAILVASHIVTGIELLAVLLCSGLVERWSGNRRIPNAFFGVVIGLIVIHVGYHVVFMNRFEEHHLITLQNTEPWLLQARSFIPAYALAGALVAWQMRTSSLARACLSTYKNRVLLVWAGTCFLLANHEFAVTPMQPVHFDRGYILAPLFLLGVGTLRSILDTLSRLPRRIYRYAGIVLLTGILLFDNACWFSALGYERTVIRKNKGDFYITSHQQAVLDWLSSCKDSPLPVVVSEDLRLGYLVITYTPLRSWASHDHETPNYKQHVEEIRALTQTGTIIDAWRSLPTLWVIQSGSSAESALIRNGAIVRFENDGYKILSLPVPAQP